MTTLGAHLSRGFVIFDPRKLAVRTNGEMHPTATTVRSAIEVWVTRVRLGDGKSHRRNCAAAVMDVTTTHRPNETLSPLLIGEHEIGANLIGRFAIDAVR